MNNSSNKYFAFGIGVAVCLILAGLLAYGIAAVNSDTVQPENAPAASAVEPQAGEPLTMARKATAQFIGTMNEPKGRAFLEESPNGVLIMLALRDMPAGPHAIHIHETGDCSPVETQGGPDPQNYFSNAGSHLNPQEREHGLLNPNGPHAGDLLNVNIEGDGTLEAHLFNDRVTLVPSPDNPDLARLLDEDGSALIIHEGTDDYRTNPTGHAGHRLACAVIKAE